MSVDNGEQKILLLEERLRKLEARLEQTEEACGRRSAKGRTGIDEPSDNDVIHLNVSGKKITVLRGTLTRFEGSMLAARFSGRWDKNIEKDKEGNFFVNQPPDLFLPLIDFLQRFENTLSAPGSVRFPTVADFGGRADRFDDFADMVEYYGLSANVLPPKIEIVTVKATRAKSPERPWPFSQTVDEYWQNPYER
jgi:BTB/POZ domain